MATNESVVAALQAQLEAYEGTYPPEAVQRVVYFPEEWMPDATYRTLYVLNPGDETIQPGTSCKLEGRAEIVVAAMRRLYDPTDNPSAGQAPERWQVANALAEDVTTAIYADHTFGGQAIGLVDQALFIDRTQSARHEAYSIVWVRFVVRYQRVA